ncbi:MAG: rhodanese-like domain-containing protein [Eubacteriales bacterium]|nr:rhodanese-like domain-containing protein [Eubacteriales bacterium]
MKKLRRLIIMLFVSLSLFSLSACQGESDNADVNTDTTANTLSYEQISAEEAKEIMDSGVEYIIIDSRTDEEFAQGHIEGAILIPEYEIANRAEAEIPDKDALILVYCRSGRRSKIASDELVKLGYTNVKEFGGIIDWPYEIVK